MLKSLKLVPRPEDQFLERYETLLNWAMSLTGGNQDQAEDIVHDAFIQFTLRRPELGTIENPDGYLHRTLRNIFLSQMRRSPQVQQMPESMADYDSAELGLRIHDPQAQMQIADELWRICQYAGARKETSQVGSVLILRFFHGYYLSEIAQLLRRQMASIYSSLKIARREAKLYRDDPNSLKLIIDPQLTKPKFETGPTPNQLLSELRDFIFSSRRGACLCPNQLHKLYKTATTIQPDCAQVAHIVSCPTCLDEVNSLLELPLLADRNPADSLDQSDRPRKGGDDDGPKDGGPGASSAEGLRRKHTRRFKEVFDHRPQELRVAVNGFVVGSQKVGQEINEQTVSVNIAERIGFVEVFSEQGVRLLLCEVAEPVDGEVQQRAEVRFSDDRKLELALDFRGAWPALQVLYSDPALGAIANAPSDRLSDVGEALTGAERPVVIAPETSPSLVSRSIERVVSALRSVTRFFLRPATVTAVFALILIAVAVFLYRRVPAPPLTAADLLARAAATEEAQATRMDQVVRRTIDIEERSSSGALIARQRIDVWQSGERGITARRLYDDRGALIAGDWRRADGVQTLYHHKAQPKLQIANPQLAIRNAEIWHLSLTAKEFTSLIESSDNARVEVTENSYIISAERSESVESAKSADVIKATLVLSRADLHAIEQTIVIQQGSESREYRFIETSFERKPPDSVAPAVFEPDAQLLSSFRPETLNPELETRNSKPETASAPILATAALEVEVIEALNNAGAFTGEQIDVSRTGDGKINVIALVETANRKQELITALANVKNNPVVRVRIETVAEAEARQNKEAKTTTPIQQPGPVERFEATEGMNPIYAELRKKFSEEEARRFVGRVLGRSGQARSHALAMKQLSGRFSQADLASLTTAERGRWLALVRGHAERFVNESEALRRELQQFFPEAAAGAAGGGAISSDSELQARARELYDASVAVDRSLNRSLALTAGASDGVPLGSAFWRQFADAVLIARSLASAK